VVTRKDYNQIGVKAAYSVMLEIIRILGEYRGNMVLIGGWVPQLLFQNTSELHTGSIDVDLAFDHKRITDDAYKTIHELLLEREYEQGDQPFIFHRRVNIDGNEVVVKVDLLSGGMKAPVKVIVIKRFRIYVHARSGGAISLLMIPLR